MGGRTEQSKKFAGTSSEYAALKSPIDKPLEEEEKKK
jgi:hypothetical protein